MSLGKKDTASGCDMRYCDWYSARTRACMGLICLTFVFLGWCLWNGNLRWHVLETLSQSQPQSHPQPRPQEGEEAGSLEQRVGQLDSQQLLASDLPTFCHTGELRDCVYQPQACTKDCYIVDIVFDSLKPRVLVVTLGLPASEIQRKKITRLSMLDIRQPSGNNNITVEGIRTQNQKRFQVVVNVSAPVRTQVTADCELIKNYYSQNSASESGTLDCTLPSEFPFEAVRSRALRATVNVHHVDDQAPLTPRPFLLNARGLSSGILGHVVRKPPEADAENVAFCLAGVDYPTRHIRELMQLAIHSGVSHVYIGIPYGAHRELFKRYKNALQDFIGEGLVSIGESAYTEEAEGGFNYRPAGHKSAFVNSCLLHSRNAGDSWTYVGDLDETPTHGFGDDMSLPQALSHYIKKEGLKKADLCFINMYLTDVFSESHKVWLNDSLNLFERYSRKVKEPVPYESSADFYGKSWHNPRRMVRVGLHVGSACEGDPSTDKGNLNLGTVWGCTKYNRTSRRKKNCNEIVRPRIDEISFYHWVSLAKNRVCRVATVPTGLPANAVGSELERRQNMHNIPRLMSEDRAKDGYPETGYSMVAKDHPCGNDGSVT